MSDHNIVIIHEKTVCGTNHKLGEQIILVNNDHNREYSNYPLSIEKIHFLTLFLIRNKNTHLFLLQSFHIINIFYKIFQVDIMTYLKIHQISLQSRLGAHFQKTNDLSYALAIP